MKFFRKQNVFLYIAKFYGIFYILRKWVIEKKSALRKISILLEKCQLIFNREHFDYLMDKFGFMVNPYNSDAGMYNNVVMLVYDPPKDRILVYNYSKGFMRANDIPHAEKVLEDTIKVISDIRLREKKKDLEEKLSTMNEDF